MVSARFVIAIGVVILFFSFGSDWIAFQSSESMAIYTMPDTWQFLGSAYGACGCPLSNSSIEGRFWQLFLPFLVSPGPLSVGLVLLPTGFILAIAALFYWKTSSAAGIASIACGALWTEGTILIQGRVVHGLNGWFGYGGRTVSSSVTVPLGPYLSAFAGVILLAAFILGRLDLIDTPID